MQTSINLSLLRLPLSTSKYYKTFKWNTFYSNPALTVISSLKDLLITHFLQEIFLFNKSRIIKRFASVIHYF